MNWTAIVLVVVICVFVLTLALIFRAPISAKIPSLRFFKFRDGKREVEANFEDVKFEEVKREIQEVVESVRSTEENPSLIEGKVSTGNIANKNRATEGELSIESLNALWLEWSQTLLPQLALVSPVSVIILAKNLIDKILCSEYIVEMNEFDVSILYTISEENKQQWAFQWQKLYDMLLTINRMPNQMISIANRLNYEIVLDFVNAVTRALDTFLGAHGVYNSMKGIQETMTEDALVSTEGEENTMQHQS